MPNQVCVSLPLDEMTNAVVFYCGQTCVNYCGHRRECTLIPVIEMKCKKPNPIFVAFHSLSWFRPSCPLSASVLRVIHEDQDFTLGAVLHSVTVEVVTTTGDGHVDACFASTSASVFKSGFRV